MSRSPSFDLGVNYVESIYLSPACHFTRNLDFYRHFCRAALGILTKDNRNNVLWGLCKFKRLMACTRGLFAGLKVDTDDTVLQRAVNKTIITEFQSKIIMFWTRHGVFFLPSKSALERKMSSPISQ